MTSPVPPTPQEEAEALAKQRGGTRRVGKMTKYWPSTITRLQAKADKKYPDVNPDRRWSPYLRDLTALGEAAEKAGYRPGDTIPPKREARP